MKHPRVQRERKHLMAMRAASLICSEELRALGVSRYVVAQLKREYDAWKRAARRPAR